MSLRVDLNGSATGFQQMLNSARTQAKAFSNSVTHEVGSSWSDIGKSFATGVAGLFTLQGLKSGLDLFIETGKEIKETSEQVDMSTDSWQKWTDAVDRAGLSTSGFMRVVEALRQKRTDAITDPKARGELSRLGFSDADITGEMDMSTFTERALKNANGGDLQRKYLSDIIGARGVKYATAVPKLKDAQALYSPDDLEQADKGAEAEKDIGKVAGKAGMGFLRFFTDENYQDSVGMLVGGSLAKIVGQGWLWGKNYPPLMDTVAQVRDHGMHRPVQAMRDGKPVNGMPAGAPDSSGAFVGPIQTEKTVDPMDAVLSRQKDEMALAEQTRQERLNDSQRSLMTIGDRRESIKGELAKLLPQIEARRKNEQGEGFLTDADKTDLEGVTGKAREFQVNKLRQKYQADTDEMQIRADKDRGDLREKPLKFDADTMSKVGLYGASSVAFNPLLGLQQKANSLLGQIAKNTTPKSGPTKDPHSP